MKPIKFSTEEMVQAILDGRKTQMRRVIPLEFQGCFVPDANLMCDNRYAECKDIGCNPKPRYKVGDVLWVKEAWRFIGWPSMDQNEYWVQFKDGKDKRLDVHDDEDFDEDHNYWIECGYDLEFAGWPSNEDGFYPPEGMDWDKDCPTRWHNARDMPKIAARIFLRVTGVRCERLQEITVSDAEKEGAVCVCITNTKHGCTCPLGQFYNFWQHIYGKKHPWKSNPFVWVYEFERCDVNQASK